jgi:hypothetical protein
MYFVHYLVLRYLSYRDEGKGDFLISTGFYVILVQVDWDEEG